MKKVVVHLEDLVDEELSAVCFVRDYVEFHFDGPVLRALAPVTARAPQQESELGEGQKGWRDNLCAFIGQKPVSVVVEVGKAIVMRFNDGGHITIPLNVGGAEGEAAHFQAKRNDPLEVWST